MRDVQALVPGRGAITAPGATPRILVVHNTYQIRGGEDAAVEREVAALRRAGHTVEALFLSNDDIRTRADRLRVAFEAAHAPRGIARVLDAVRGFRPDVVHAHNTFPLISPAVHAAVRATGAATVQTLHNYRLTCAGGQLLRGGAPCEDCVTGSAYQAVRHACYRGSRLGSLAVARMIAAHRQRDTWTAQVDRFIALTPFSKSRFVAAGLPDARISVKPNGLPDPGLDRDRPRDGLLFVGRLSPEKGLSVLAAAAQRSGLRVDVIGEGPLAADLAGASHLTLHGPRDRAGVADAMARAAAVVVPSLWYEGLPMVIAEAFASGTPVIASNIGSLADVVEHGGTGLLVRPGDADALADALGWVAGHSAEAARMGAEARAVFERDWSEDVTTAALLSIYADAIASRSTEGCSHVA